MNFYVAIVGVVIAGAAMLVLARIAVIASDDAAARKNLRDLEPPKWLTLTAEDTGLEGDPVLEVALEGMRDRVSVSHDQIRAAVEAVTRSYVESVNLHALTGTLRSMPRGDYSVWIDKKVRVEVPHAFTDLLVEAADSAEPWSLRFDLNPDFQGELPLTSESTQTDETAEETV